MKLSKSPKTKKKRQNSDPLHLQYAALPWRINEGVEILLLTSRGSRRWIIPKGWPIRTKKPHEVAAIEAREEAGLLGNINKTRIGFFHYSKRFDNGAVAPCKVEVFPLRVSRQLSSWPEKDERLTRWFDFETAAQRVHEPELRDLILAFGQALSDNASAA